MEQVYSDWLDMKVLVITVQSASSYKGTLLASYDDCIAVDTGGVNEAPTYINKVHVVSIKALEVM